jgi:hypothetical protein
MKRTALALTLTLVLFAPSMVNAQTTSYSSLEPISFSSGLTIYSPVNTIYNSYSVLCNATLRVPYGYQSSLVYSIDGKEQDSSNFQLMFGSSGKYRLVGLFMLPPLHNGPHQLTFNIRIQLFNYSGPPPSSDYKAGVTSYGVKYYEADYENTILFTIYSNEPFPTPTPSLAPTPTPTATPTPTPEPTATPEATSQSATFPASLVFVASVGIALAVIGLFVYFKKYHRDKSP